jgi:hypothetical protein
MYTYGQVERALAQLHGIPPERAAGKLRSRLKHFSRIGLTPSRPGKGQKLLYTSMDCARWAICLEFAQLETPPGGRDFLGRGKLFCGGRNRQEGKLLQFYATVAGGGRAQGDRSPPSRQSSHHAEFDTHQTRACQDPRHRLGNPAAPVRQDRLGALALSQPCCMCSPAFSVSTLFLHVFCCAMLQDEKAVTEGGLIYET